MRRTVAWLLGAALAGGTAIGLAAAPPAVAATQICEQYGSTTIQGGRYVVQNNRWGTSATQCITPTDSGFTVDRAEGSVATNGAPKSYPSVFFGCHYGSCSDTGGLLGATGLRASDQRFRQITTSVGMRYPSSGTYDAAYDIWFNKSQPSATTGQNDGAELMVWLNHTGSIQPIGSRVGTATVAGATWDVWYGNSGWNVISYVRQQPTASADFAVADFWDDVVRRGYGSTSWYLTSIQAGFEPWEGGAGLAVDSFSVQTGSSPTPAPTPTPTTTPTPTPGAGCSASYTTVNSWGVGFQGEVTVHNTGTTPLSGWTVGWTFAGGQTVGNAWNAQVSQSGTAVTGRDAGYNGAVPAGGSATFGFVASGSAPSSATFSCD